MKTSMKKRDINLVNKSRVQMKTHHFIFKAMPNDLGHGRIAFIIPKKRGNAVLRNLYKRRFRALIIAHDLTGHDFLCIVKNSLIGFKDEIWKLERKKIKEWCENL